MIFDFRRQKYFTAKQYPTKSACENPTHRMKYYRYLAIKIKVLFLRKFLVDGREHFTAQLS